MWFETLLTKSCLSADPAFHVPAGEQIHHLFGTLHRADLLRKLEVQRPQHDPSQQVLPLRVHPTDIPTRPK